MTRAYVMQCMTALLVTVFAILMQISAVLADQKVCWGERLDGKILCADTDGNSLEELVAGIAPQVEGIAVDIGGGRIYWISNPPAGNSDKIQSAKIDGTDVADVVTIGNGDAHGLAIEQRTDIQNRIVHVYTDASQIGGSSSPFGADSVATAAGVVAERVTQVNCLGVGSVADCSFTTGTGSFSEIVTGLVFFEDALRGHVQQMVALPGPTALTVVLDSSASIVPTSFQAILTSYANVLTAEVPTDGSVTLSAVNFAGANTATIIVEPTRIGTAGDMTTVANALLAAPFLGGPAVQDADVAGGIHLAAQLLLPRLYWTDQTRQLIERRSILAGSPTEIVVNTGNVVPRGIRVDSVNGRIYWADAKSDEHKIEVADLDGSNRQDVISSGLGAPLDVALDLDDGKIYWTDANSTNLVQRANLDGSGREELVSGNVTPVGIDLEIAAGRMFWTNRGSGTGNGKVRRADLDGSTVVDIVSNLNNPEYLALLQPPPVAVGHFLLYDVKITKNTPKFEKRTVALADQFDAGGPARDFDVDKAERLGNPADKAGEGIGDPDSHLVAYKIKKSPGIAKHVRLTGVQVSNQFGEIVLDTQNPDQLLVPSLKDLGAPIPGGGVPDPFPLDHFKCYKVKIKPGTAKFEKRDVQVIDQFNQPAVLEVEKPERLCNPVDKNGEGIANPDGHLLCYKVKRAKPGPKFNDVMGIHINNQFGALQLDAKKESELCLPSTKDVSAAVPIGG